MAGEFAIAGPDAPDALPAFGSDEPPVRRGRPPGTSARALELIALDLFSRQGFDDTTVDQITAAAGVSKRTFFRYFDTKADVLWHAFDAEIDNLNRTLGEVTADQPVMAAVREAVLAVNHYRADDVGELRTRMTLISSVPELGASAASHYDAWERAISTFVAARTGLDAGSLYPLTVGRATLATCRAAYEQWAVRADADLTAYLDVALRALAGGFADDVLTGRGAGA